MNFKEYIELHREGIYSKICEYVPVKEPVEHHAIMRDYVDRQGSYRRPGLVMLTGQLFGAKPEDLIVIHDESDLPLGTYKISYGKNSAGHKGVQSVMDALGTKDFTRIRIGIRPGKELRRSKAAAFVLKHISARDKKTLDGVFQEIADILPTLL